MDKRPARIVGELQIGAHAARGRRRASAAGSDGRLLAQPLQRVRRQGRLRWYLPALGAHGDPPPRARPLPRRCCGRARGIPAMLFYLDNWLSTRPDFVRRGGPESGPARRPQRELRARADGAAHARRRRRLHAAGRHRGGARVHRLDDRPSARGCAAFVFRVRDCTTTAPRWCSAHASSGGGRARRRGSVSTSWPRHPSTARSSRRKLARRVRGRRSAARAGRSRRRPLSRTPDGDIRAMLRAIFTSPEFVAPDTLRRQGQEAARVRGQRGARHGRDGRRPRRRRTGRLGRDRRGLYVCAAAHRLPRSRGGVGQSRTLLARMNFALALSEAGARRERGRGHASSPAPIGSGRRSCSNACWPR